MNFKIEIIFVQLSEYPILIGIKILFTNILIYSILLHSFAVKYDWSDSPLGQHDDQVPKRQKVWGFEK